MMSTLIASKSSLGTSRSYTLADLVIGHVRQALERNLTSLTRRIHL